MGNSVDTAAYETAIERAFVSVYRAAQTADDLGLWGEQLDLEQILVELARLQEDAASGRRRKRLRLAEQINAQVKGVLASRNSETPQDHG